MEENKDCCEGKTCEKGEGCCHLHGHCCGLKKCHMVKCLIWFIIIIVVFCLGAQFGELKSEARGGREFRGSMMDWNYKSVKPITNEVTPSVPATTPEVKQ